MNAHQLIWDVVEGICLIGACAVGCYWVYRLAKAMGDGLDRH